MISDILSFFNDSDGTMPSVPDENEIRIATAALMYEVGLADDDLSQDEQNAIESALAATFDISQTESRQIAKIARERSTGSTSLHSFTSVITKNWPYDDRYRIIELMWDVALADGRLDDHEQHLMRKLASLLYIPHKAYIAAKIRARDKLDAANSS